MHQACFLIHGLALLPLQVSRSMSEVEKIIGIQIDQFKVESLIARGAMGMVFKAYDSMLTRVVALKLIPRVSEIAADSEDFRRTEAQKRLLHEAQAAGNLVHPNIVTIHSYGETDEFKYICMEHIEGRTLSQILDEQGPIPAGAAIPIVEQVLLALDAADKASIVHRDIKPSNIMITEDGRVKVMDFGIAKLPSLSLTVTGMVLGTPYYMSPEQICGKKVDIRSDIFSLGAVFYEMLTGGKPFEAENTATLVYKIVQTDPVPPDNVNANIPKAVAAVIAKAMAKEPDQRYQKPAEMLNGVKALAPAGRNESAVRASAALEFDRTLAAVKHESGDSPVTQVFGHGCFPSEQQQQAPAVHIEEVSNPPVAPPERSPQSKKRILKTKLGALSLMAVSVCVALFWYFIRSPVHDSKPSVPRQHKEVQQAGPQSSGSAGHKSVQALVSQPGAGKNLPVQTTAEALLSEAEKQFASNPDGAEKLLEEALTLNPNSYDCILSLARLLVSQRDYQAAAHRYKQALNLNGSSPDIYCELGNTYMRLTEYDMAIDSFQACLTLRPRNKDEVLANIGTCYERKGDADRAQVFFKQALEVNPANAGARSYMASAAAKAPSPTLPPAFFSTSPAAGDAPLKSWQPGRQALPQKTVSPVNAVPGNAETIAGNYMLDGINPSGNGYRGSVEITQNGGKYAVTWKIAGQTYSGAGTLSGQFLTVDRKGPGVMKGVVAYGMGARGVLIGTYGSGKGKETLKRIN